MKRIGFYVLVAIQVLFLVGMAIAYYVIDDVGETIKLQTLPVDPQDLFYGDYVTLRYQIEEIPDEKWLGDTDDTDGRIHVIVEQADDGFHQVVKASNQKLQASENQAKLTAAYRYYDAHSQTHHVNYGINRYYIEDNTGAQYEQSGEMEVTVAVAPWGHKKIEELK
ncbi:GDYXXLXY domain-containing protein [Aquibacillus sediminis]|uniref:GDYXXLXY domain-containing protein n=1 Tax=Aquibacillus sediminis TaxID=2574734 RepID=UPI0011092476|nr:GDYXXLXY domain-containing protein [Aquibacillus sediminis]